MAGVESKEWAVFSRALDGGDELTAFNSQVANPVITTSQGKVSERLWWGAGHWNDEL